jgi:cation:H+ antiporter
MSAWLWAGVLVVAVFAAHWGAERLSEPLKKLRRQWGFSAVAGGAFIGLAAASPEIGINTASAIRGVAEIGLGAMLGSNIIAIPLMVTTAYLASRRMRPGGDGGGQGDGGGSSGGDQGPESRADHERHLGEHLVRVKHEAVTVQALPYLAILALVALLTVPAPWRGLQPVDGWIMLAAYLAYLGQAVFRGCGEGQDVQWKKKELALAVAGVVVLAVGAYFTVTSTKNIVSALGISPLIGGLFITATMAALPEIFATWSVTKSGQVTSAATSVLGDHAVTMTIAFFPLALVTVPVKDFQLYWVNLAFVALMPALYAALLHWGSREHGFKRWEVLVIDGAYLAYLAVVLFWVLNVL